MKNLFKLLTVVFVVGLLFTACKKEASTSTNKVEHKAIAKAEYQCPMKCEGEKTYKDKGSCPVCKMDLKKVATKDQP